MDEVFLKEDFLFFNIRSIQDPFTLKTSIGFSKIDDIFIIDKWRSLSHYILWCVADKTINTGPGFRKQVPGVLWHYKGFGMDNEIIHKLHKTIDMQVKKRQQ